VGIKMESGRGRPPTGYEPKSKLMKFYVEPTIYGELKMVCTMVGISVAEGIRRGIMMFINEVKKHYFG